MIIAGTVWQRDLLCTQPCLLQESTVFHARWGRRADPVPNACPGWVRRGRQAGDEDTKRNTSRERGTF